MPRTKGKMKVKTKSKSKSVPKGSFKYKGQIHKVNRIFDGKKYGFAVASYTKAEAEKEKKRLKKFWKSVRIVKKKQGYWVYVRGRK